MFTNNRRRSVLRGLTTLALCGAISLGITSVVNATLLYCDDINYSAGGSIVGQNSNSTTPAAYQFNGGWYGILANGTATVTDSDLVQGAGNAVTLTPTSGTTFYGIRLGDATGSNVSTLGEVLPTNKTLWFSFLGDITTYGGRFITMGLRSDLGTIEALSVGKFSSYTTWGIGDNTNMLFAYGDPVVEGQTRRCVVKLVLDDTTPSMTLWTLDPTAVPTEASLGAGASLTGFEQVSVDMLSTVDTLAIGSGYTNGYETTSIGVFDSFRIGTEYGDVVVSDVPEPSAIALMLSAIVGMLAYAWRKRK